MMLDQDVPEPPDRVAVRYLVAGINTAEWGYVFSNLHVVPAQFDSAVDFIEDYALAEKTAIGTG